MNPNLIPAERRHTELGTEQQCKTCGDWWPLDRQFWHTTGSAGRFKTVCKDCLNTSQRQRTSAPAQVPHVPEIFRAVQWGGQ